MHSVLPRLGRAFIVGAVAAAAPLLSAQAQEEKVVPVHEEPRHHLVFDGPQLRILDIQVPPGDTTLFHTHSDPILYISMSSSRTRSQTLGTAWGGGEAAAAPPTGSGRIDAAIPGTGAASSAPLTLKPNPQPARANRMYSVTTYATQPLTHRVNNQGDTLFRLIGITNPSTGDSATTASADFAAKPEVDNQWFRAYRWNFAGDPPAEHRHANPVAIVLINGRGSVSAGRDTPLDTPGSFAVVDANVPHRLHATGPAEIAEIEIRKPRS